MKALWSLTLFLLVASSACRRGAVPPEKGPVLPPSSELLSDGVLLGIDVLEQSGFLPVRDMGRVGLVTNQTSVNRKGVATREILHQAPEVNLTALFTPEHGLDGKEKAAAYIPDRQDPLTGLTAFSLYGPTRKPTPDMLAGVDALLFDLQDIGCRSYTYISTMILAMEACGEQDKLFVVLDRPNPLGGLRVQGPPLNPEWKSFVGQVPVPYVHGLTAGELAEMANAKRWLASPCDLTVISMKGWNRGMTWEDTGLAWVPTSPNIPHARSPCGYVLTGILGSLTGADIGIGTEHPFQFCGAHGIDPAEFTHALRRLPAPGIHFTPYQSSRRPGYAGSRIHIDPATEADLVALDIALIHEVNKRIDPDLFARTKPSGKTIFYKVYGSKGLEEDLSQGKLPFQIAEGWKEDNEAFQRDRAPYLLYQSGPAGGVK